MARATRNFSDAYPGETEVYSLDFTDDLGEGETITGSTWSLAVVSGIDADVATRISGSPGLADNEAGVQAIATQRLTNLQPGVRYRVQAFATTSNSNTLDLHTFVWCKALETA